MTPFLLFIACIIGISSGTTYFTTYNSDNETLLGGREISVETDPEPKFYVDGESIDLTTAGSRQDDDDYTLYSDFPDLPGYSLKLFNDGGYTVYYEHNGVVTKFGTLSDDEKEQMNQEIQDTFQNVNKQFGMVQEEIGNMMHSVWDMFNSFGWPFFG